MHVLLIGQGPLPCANEAFCNFAQLRTWSIRNILQKWASNSGHSLQFIDLRSKDIQQGFNVYNARDNVQIQTISQSADAIVTAGPFLPHCILDLLPANTPLWVDFPSDPFADRWMKQKVHPIEQNEWNFTTEIAVNALRRADALSVISERQQWSTLGQLLLLHRPEVPISTIPIAFEFPESKRTTPSKGTDIVISGSNNSWLDIPNLETKLKDHTVHCTGMTEKNQLLPKNWHTYGWLKETELTSILKQCGFGVWSDYSGPESDLGSRTRALFYLWHGLTPIGTLNTELAQTLYNAGFMRSWSDDQPFTPIPIKAAQDFCHSRFHPAVIYQPILDWLELPANEKRRTNEVSPDIHAENLRLRQSLQQIHQSPTWRWGSRVHKGFLRIKRSFR